MADHAAVEHEIRHLLATEDRTTVLSNALFEQGTGLFWKIATTEDERRALIKTSLYKEAQSRVRELQYRDADVLAKADAVIRADLPGANVRLTIGDPARVASYMTLAEAEAEIRRLLATETHTVRLSNALFGQFTGLFWKIATTEDERRVLVDTPLFREAQARIREFQYRDANALGRAAS